MPDLKLAIAPMMDYTDRHDRYFLRLFSKNIWLYTEMVTSQALVKGDAKRLLKYDDFEHPIALQLGGSDKNQLAIASVMAEDAGYDEVNLNVGCPSDRVQSGKFGACLMAEPTLVANCISHMQKHVSIPVTVKCRIGIDDQDEGRQLPLFIKTLEETGCQTFIIHARKAWLKGLSPKENRDVPPLNYPLVYDMKNKFPHLKIIINGGVQNLQEAKQHLKMVDGVMIGRAAYHDPYILAAVDREIFKIDTLVKTRKQILQTFIPYVDRELSQGVKLSQMSRHILGLFQGLPGARQWRRYLSENANNPNATSKILMEAASFVQE